MLAKRASGWLKTRCNLFEGQGFSQSQAELPGQPGIKQLTRDHPEALLQRVNEVLFDHQYQAMTDPAILNPPDLPLASCLVSRDPLPDSFKDGLLSLGFTPVETEAGGRADRSLFSRFQKARTKLDALPSQRERSLVVGDLHDELHIENASVVILTLTLQFVRPLHRERVIQSIADGMNPQGALILVEKLTENDTLFNRLFIKYYYDMKRRHGYSELEISQKREALENVLIPYHLEENEALVRRCGFTKFQVWFRWYNFCGMIAVK